MDNISSWSSFWRQAGPDACTSELPLAAQQLIANQWREWFGSLGAIENLLDVGTGRGAVIALARCYLSKGDSAEMTGMDLVKPEPPMAAPAHYLGGMDICELPFEDGAFEIVTSQFAIEYAGLIPAIHEAARVCRRSLRALIHAESGVIRTHSAEQARQVDVVLSDKDFETRLEIILKRSDRQGLNEFAAALTNLAAGRPNRFVLDGTAAFTASLTADISEFYQVSNFASQLRGHKERMKAMMTASASLEDVEAAAKTLTERDFVVRTEKLGLDGLLLGHVIEGTRLESMKSQ